MQKLPIFNVGRVSKVEGRALSESRVERPESRDRRFGCFAVDCGLWTLDSGSRTLHPGRWTLCGAALLAGTIVLGPFSVGPGLQGANQTAGNQAQRAAEPGQTTGEPAHSETLPAPADVLQSARDKLQEYRPIKATIIERVAIGDRRFKAEGSYLHGADLKLRLEFRVRLGGSKSGLDGSLLQVCDGQVLWTRHKIGDDVHITRRDVRQILRAAEGREDLQRSLLVADLGLGGVPAVLASLENTMNFQTTRQQRIGDNDFLMIEGTWKDDFLNRFTGGEASQADEKLSPPRLPQIFPEMVRVYLDQKTLFPRRIQYLKRPADRDFFQPMVTLDFVKIVLNASVNEEDFYFVPGDGVFQQDITNQYLQLLESGTGRSGSGPAQPAQGKAVPPTKTRPTSSGPTKPAPRKTAPQ